jgi:hypothetical protein
MIEVENLKWPENRLQLALLSIQNLEAWYAAQDPKQMIFIGNTPEFKRFWHWSYVLPVRFYRKLLKIKHFAFGSRSERQEA